MSAARHEFGEEVDEEDDEEMLLSGEEEGEEEEGESDEYDESEGSDGDGAGGSGAYDGAGASRWPTSPSVSYFLSALFIGASLLAVALVSLEALDHFYAKGFEGLDQVKSYADLFELEGKLTLLSSIDPLYSLTRDPAIFAKARTVLEDLPGEVRRLVEGDNGTAVQTCLRSALLAMENRAALVSSGHDGLSILQSKRTPFFLEHPADSVTSTDFTVANGLTALNSGGTALLVDLQVLLSNAEKLHTSLFRRDPLSVEVAAIGSLQTELRYVLGNISALLLAGFEDVHASEAMVLNTEYARESSELPFREGTIYDNYHMRQLNDTYSVVSGIHTELNTTVALLALVSSGNLSSTALSPSQKILVELTTLREIGEILSKMQNLQEGLVVVRAMYLYHRKVYRLEEKYLEPKKLLDLGFVMHDILGEQSVVGRCVEQLDAILHPLMDEAQQRSEAVVQRLTDDSRAEVGEGRRNIQIAVGVCLSPLLFWLVYALAGISSQMRESFLAYRHLVLFSIALVVVVAGIGAAIASVTIDVLEEDLGMVGTLESADHARLKGELLAKSIETFAYFLRNDYDNQDNFSVAQFPTAVTSEVFSRVPMASSMTRMLGEVGTEGLDHQFHMDENIYMLFNRSKALLHVTNATSTSTDDTHAIVDNLQRALAFVALENNPTTRADCAAFVSAVAGVMISVPYIVLASTESQRGELRLAVSNFGGLASTLAVKCRNPRVTGPLWTLPSAKAPSLQHAGSNPTLYLPNYASSPATVIQGVADIDATLAAYTSEAEAAVRFQHSLWYDRKVRYRRTLVWLTAATLILGEGLAYILSWNLFGAEIYLE